MMNKQLIIGIGSGRCGTVSLYKLLNSQENSNINHESVPLLTWKFNEGKIAKKLDSLINKKGKYVGDVASYYLPYVEYIIKKFPDSKFVCLKRAKEEVVRSFMKKIGKWNHWITHFGIKWKKAGKWENIFPKYNLDTKEKAIDNYWDDYYKEAERLVKKYPKNIKIFGTEDLNSEGKIAEILKFCRIDERDKKIVVGIKENKSKDKLFSVKYVLWRANKI